MLLCTIEEAFGTQDDETQMHKQNIQGSHCTVITKGTVQYSVASADKPNPSAYLQVKDGTRYTDFQIVQMKECFPEPFSYAQKILTRIFFITVIFCQFYVNGGTYRRYTDLHNKKVQLSIVVPIVENIREV